MTRICLNMIVRNEQAIIERCLLAVAPYIDCYVICDTGSSDATISTIKRFFDARGIRGVIPTIKFQNFEQARNEALDAARSSSMEFDYLLFCDADMEFKADDPDFKSRLTSPVYSMMQRNSDSLVEYFNPRLVHRRIKSQYRGVTHEYLDVDGATKDRLSGVWYLDYAVGANRINKYERDIRLLSEALSTDQNNARSVFYLAQSYRDAKMPEKALLAYDKRAEMTGFDEETFCALLEGARLARQLEHPASEVIERFLKAYEFRPSRAESLGDLARYLGEGKKRWAEAYHFAEKAIQIPPPNDILFVELEWYRWRCLDDYAVAAYWIGEYQKSLSANEKLLARNDLSNKDRARIMSNANFARSHIPAAPGTTKAPLKYW